MLYKLKASTTDINRLKDKYIIINKLTGTYINLNNIHLDSLEIMKLLDKHIFINANNKVIEVLSWLEE